LGEGTLILVGEAIELPNDPSPELYPLSLELPKPSENHTELYIYKATLII
jgi:hypothetical protein